MKKNIVLLGFLVIEFVNAQVGINTTNPQATLDITRHTTVSAESPQGLLLPHLTTDQRDAFSIEKLVKGLMIFNTTKNCIDWWNGEKWSCTNGEKMSNTVSIPSVKADVWDRTYYIASFNHSGVNIDGVIDNNNNRITLNIAYNQATVGNAYNEINIERTVKDSNGNNKTLTLYIPAGVFSHSKGFLAATIRVGNGTTDNFSVKKLNAFEEEVLTTFSFDINGNVSNVKLVASGGVKDKKFGSKDYNFIYVPVSAYPSFVETLPDRGTPYEKKWLNNNLGADYAKVGNNQHTKQAITKDDENAYGYLYEWNRNSDGHEVINWYSSTAGSFQYNKRNRNFKNKDEYNPKKNAGDPCPTGYHTPTDIEILTLYKAITHNADYPKLMWQDRTLNLSAAGGRYSDSDTLGGTGSVGLYWGSTPNDDNINAWSMSFSSNTSDVYNNYYRTHGYSVRCIADNQ